MDNKIRVWRKKSAEMATEKANKRTGEMLVADTEDRERDLTILNDLLGQKNAETARPTGWDREETESIFLKQELGKALQKKVAAEERSMNLDAALKECMQQLRFVREEQKRRIHDEFEKDQMYLAENLEESRKKLSKLSLENLHLSKALLEKERVIEDLNEHQTLSEGDLNALKARLESSEKDKASLKYEVQVLEKELDIRKKEREFNRRMADASNKQHLESEKKIAKLESECQRLRILVQKRLPGPAALTKMRNEVAQLGNIAGDKSPSNKITPRTEQFYSSEDDKTLKESLHNKTHQLQLSRTMPALTASKSSRAVIEPMKNSLVSQGSCLGMESHDDTTGSSESQVLAQISELGNFKNGSQKSSPSCKTAGISDIKLMDDFDEMEKLAMVSVSAPSERSNASSKDKQIKNLLGWLQNVLNVIMEQCHSNQKTGDHILDDIRVALDYVNNSIADAKESVTSSHDSESESEAESGMTSQSSAAVFNVYNGLFQVEDLQCDAREENTKLKEELLDMELAKKGLEERLQMAIKESDSSKSEGEESKKRLASLQTELEDQIEKQKSANEDLARCLAEVNQKLSALEVELASKNNCCEELEARCLELQLKLESMMKEASKKDEDQVEKALQPDWEATAASEKLAACQKTIINLGKQLKALSSQSEAEPVDKVTSSTLNTKTTTMKSGSTSHRSSLLDQMLAEDDAMAEDLKSVTTIKAEEAPTRLLSGRDEVGVSSSRKWGGQGFLKKMLKRGKKGSSKKMGLL